MKTPGRTLAAALRALLSPAALTRSLARIAAVVGLASLAGAQTTWYVDGSAAWPGSGTQANPWKSVQQALSNPSVVDGDTVIVAGGIYIESVDFLGKAVTVQSSGGSGDATLDGSSSLWPNGSVVSFTSGETSASVLRGFTIRAGTGTIDAVYGTAVGGGVYMVGSSPTLDDCVITGNSADMGGGVFGRNASPTIESSTICDNLASQSGVGGGFSFEDSAPLLRDVSIEANATFLTPGGGGWCQDSTPTFEQCAFTGNGKNLGAFALSIDGGGLALAGCSPAIFSDCVFEKNEANDGFGGGLLLWSSDVTMDRCHFDANRANNDYPGGAIQVDGNSSLTFRDGSITNNHSARGGGIASSGTLVLEDSRIADNQTAPFMFFDGNGGGVWSSGPATVRRCIFDGNQSAFPTFWGPPGGFGGAIYGASVALENCTVALNTGSDRGGVDGASLLNCIHWLNTPPALATAQPVTYSDVEGGFAGLGNIAGDPLFRASSERDFHIAPSSPCVDAGDPSSPLDPDGSRADMGALPLTPLVESYCTAGVSASGCQAALAASGFASATAASGFVVTAGSVEGGRNGLFFFGANGRQASAWGNSSSYQCVVPPVRRGALLTGTGGTGTCAGAFSYDLNAHWTAKPAHNPGAGATGQVQLWYRDPASTSNQATGLSDALEYAVWP